MSDFYTTTARIETALGLFVAYLLLSASVIVHKNAKLLWVKNVFFNSQQLTALKRKCITWAK